MRSSVHPVFMLVALVALLVPVCWAGPIVETLENGCRMVIEEDHSRPVAAFRIYVGVGAVFEGEYLGAGISHFIEHTVSEGTATRTGEQIDTTLEELGNASNAYTTKDSTCYYITTAGEMVSEAIDLLSDFVLHATFPEEEVEMQRGIILREIAMGDDEPGRRIYNLMAETVFATHPYRYRTIGYAEAFKALTRDDLVGFHQRWYVPDNMVVVAVGDFDGAAVARQLREAFGSVPRRAPPAVELAQELVQIAPRRRIVSDEAVQRAYLQMGWRTVSIFHPDLYPLDVLSYILTAGDSSVLVSKLRDDLGLVDGISSYSATPSYDAGFFVIAPVLEAAKLAEAEAAILAELDRLRSRPGGMSEADLKRVQTQMAAEEVYGQETAEGRASALGRNLLITGDVNFSERYLAGIRSVTPEQIQQVLEKYFRPEKHCVAILRPPAETTGPAGPEQKQTKAQTHVKKLGNGLTVIVYENHVAPVVSICTATLGGLRYESEQTAGITALMANTLIRGTKTRSRQQIAETVDRLGGMLDTYSGRNSFGVTAHFLSGDFPTALELTVDVLFNPSFPEEEFARQKQLTLAAIARQADDPQTWALKSLLGELYTVHPYRFTPVGTEASVERLTREDVATFHEFYARANGTAVVISGDVKPDDAFAQAEKLMGQLRADAPVAAKSPQEPPIESRRTKVIERAQQQAIVAYGFIGPKVTDADRAALDVLDAALSGIRLPGGRLHNTLRGRQLVYFVHAYPVCALDPGYFIIYAGTRPDKVETVQGIIEQIVADIKAEPLPPEELERAKGMCIAADRVALQTNAALAQTMALDMIYGLGHDNWRSYSERIGAVTAEQVQRVAEELLDLQRCALVVTRPAEE